MDVARLNFSWGTHAEHSLYIKNIRQAARLNKKYVPIIQDLSGPRIQKSSGHYFDKLAIKALTVKDKKDLAFGLESGVDWVAMSFVGSAKDIIELRSAMRSLGRVVPIIAKIERKIALKNFNEILRVSDSIMIARGDLGNEVSIGKIPFIEKEIIDACKWARKPVITATQMLWTMKDSPQPTRAEVTDVVYAVLNGSDAVMLSEETASGKFPQKAVATMESIILEAEKHLKKIKINRLRLS